MTKSLRLLWQFSQLFLKLDCCGAKLFSLARVMLMYVRKQKKINILNSEKKQNYEKTNVGLMKRP